MYARIGRFPDEDSDTEREIDVIVHSYDTWSADHTIALIALPLLKQLKETKQGVPYVDYEDMPEHLQYNPRQYDARAVEDLFNKWDDFNHEFDHQVKVWDWMMDEMIWAMDQLVNEDEVDPEVWYSKEFNDRMSNALRLFGKYFRSLWD